MRQRAAATDAMITLTNYREVARRRLGRSHLPTATPVIIAKMPLARLSPDKMDATRDTGFRHGWRRAPSSAAVYYAEAFKPLLSGRALMAREIDRRKLPAGKLPLTLESHMMT